MPIIKKSFGKNYLQCYESEKGKTYSCEQIRKSWDNKVNYVTENSLKNTKEEAQKEFVDAFILRLLSEKKLWKIAHANIVDSAGNITDGRAMLDKLSSPLVLENINTILKNNPVLLETWQTIALEDILGRELTEGTGKRHGNHSRTSRINKLTKSRHKKLYRMFTVSFCVKYGGKMSYAVIFYAT